MENASGVGCSGCDFCISEALLYDHTALLCVTLFLIHQPLQEGMYPVKLGQNNAEGCAVYRTPNDYVG